MTIDEIMHRADEMIRYVIDRIKKGGNYEI